MILTISVAGKTLAFSIPALAHLKHRVETEGRAKKGSPMMLIIAPTRELAMQSQVVLEQAGSLQITIKII